MPETQTPPPAAPPVENKIYPPAAGTPPPAPPATPPATPPGTPPNDSAGKTPPADGGKTPPTGDKQGTDGTQRVVPETYDLTIPDGSLLDAKAKDQISAFAKERKLTQDEAQAILERESALLSSYVDGQKQELIQKQKEWVDSVKADREVGGEAFPKNVEMAKRVIERFGSDDFKKTLNDTGLGNHPELVRFAVRIGKAMSEDQLVLPGAQPAAKKSMEDVFYPSNAPK